MPSCDVAVIGGGIVGCATGFYAARRGLDTVVFERGESGGATRQAAGILPAPHFLAPDESLTASNAHAVLSRRSYEFYRQLLEDLRDYAESDVGFRQAGSLNVATTDEGRQRLRKYCEEMQRYDRPCRWLSAQAVHERLPRLTAEVTGGFRYEDECVVEPGSLLDALVTGLEEEGGRLIPETSVDGLHRNDGRIDAVSTAGGRRWDTNAVVLAAGTWSRQFEDVLNVEVPVEPRRGQIVVTHWEALEEQPVLRHEDFYVVGRSGGEVLVGATVEDAGFEVCPTLGGVEGLIRRGAALFEGLRTRRFVEVRVGLRPYLRRKGGPLLGRVPDLENAYLGVGHYKSGILQGPFSGYLLARMVDGAPLDFKTEVFEPPR